MHKTIYSYPLNCNSFKLSMHNRANTNKVSDWCTYKIIPYNKLEKKIKKTEGKLFAIK